MRPDSRPCNGCERGSPFTGEYDINSQCRTCWLFYNHPTYHQMWASPQAVTVSTPSLVQKIVHAGKAHAEWAAQGAPTRTQEEQDRIWSICKACPELDAN